ncbi:hypothetical protein [Streptomyces sp. NBC_01264]|uniref:hypothetical protein n=1 Tax=Streptomyces sp. NBC_01264 TaxID=2903804 RepID=UPI002254C702|nr:hypothetical protein [Streptomyces sp. NBC_01264]MCX4776894.1 hypothetical protein [Streptomyces sp. NBC_01264]
MVRLLALGDQFTQHNDHMARLRPTYGAARGHASAQILVLACLEAVQAIADQPIHANVALTEAAVRIKQLAVLTGQAVRHLAEAKALLSAPASPPALASRGGEIERQIQLARELTALAPAAAVESASTVALEIHRRRNSTNTTADGLTPAERTALHATARGHVVIGRQQGREYVHSRDSSVDIGTLRVLEGNGLIAIEPAGAPPAFDGGPPLDRVRLTLSGALSVAALLGYSPQSPARATPTARPALSTPSPTRVR